MFQERVPLVEGQKLCTEKVQLIINCFLAIRGKSVGNTFGNVYTEYLGGVFLVFIILHRLFDQVTKIIDRASTIV